MSIKANLCIYFVQIFWQNYRSRVVHKKRVLKYISLISQSMLSGRSEQSLTRRRQFQRLRIRVLLVELLLLDTELDHFVVGLGHRFFGRNARRHATLVTGCWRCRRLRSDTAVWLLLNAGCDTTRPCHVFGRNGNGH